jgi:glycosyltransferase involved in cell wall biosynthesis
MHKYDLALDELVDALNMGNAITFTGRVTDAQLKSYYKTANLYMTASRHEGFCVPLVESMYFGVPILARKATAIPETLGDAGSLFTHLGYEEVVEMAHLIFSDDSLRLQIIQKQKERLEALSPTRAEIALKSTLAHLNLPHNPPEGTG